MNGDWQVIPNFLPNNVVAQLAHEVQQLAFTGKLHRAAVGAGDGRTVRDDVRGDQIFWLDEATLTEAQAHYWREMDALRQRLNEELFLGLASLEAHLALYPAGSFYCKHLDRFANNSDRTLSCSFYLNENWLPEHGGQLRIYHDNGFTDVLPEAGTLALFRSDTVYHEVLPATRPRLSLTGWFKRRSL